MCHNENLVQGTTEHVPPPPLLMGVWWLIRQIWFIHENSEGPGESAHLSLTRAFVLEPKPHVLTQMSFFLTFFASREGYGDLHICLVQSEPSSQFKNIVLAQMAIQCYFVQAANALASLHICTGLP